MSENQVTYEVKVANLDFSRQSKVLTTDKPGFLKASTKLVLERALEWDRVNINVLVNGEVKYNAVSKVEASFILTAIEHSITRGRMLNKRRSVNTPHLKEYVS